MAKLFIFGIGGTGARVIKSLTFLLASGVDINASEIIPIFIDPHDSNKDLQRTDLLLSCYQNIYKKIDQNFTINKFFKTKITKLGELKPKEKTDINIESDNFRFTLTDTKNRKFKDFIKYGDSLGIKNKSFVELLFSEKNLESDMDKGFKGNPNIGSVVLNQIKDSNHFKYFASSFDENDRIFIISSPFGGTGAAGFPLILKNIREAEHPLPNAAFLKNSKIGAVSVLPYFGVEPDDTKDIDKSTFYSKSRAALSYYEDNLSKNNSLNALYYICDTITKDYINDPGEGGQQNDAHIIELFASRLIIDFMDIPDDLLTTKNGKASDPKYREFSTWDYPDEQPFNLPLFCDTTKNIINKNLIIYFYFYLYMTYQIKQSLNQPWAKRGDIKFDENFLTKDEGLCGNLLDFNKRFFEWLSEMAGNRRSFIPFNLSFTSANVKKILFKLINGIPERNISTGNKKNFALFDHWLNKAEKKIIEENIIEKKFIDMFYYAISNIITNKFNL